MIRHIAFVSPLGGTGQTSLVANLALLLVHHRAAPCLAVDLCPQNQLGFHFGLKQSATSGWAKAALAGDCWTQSAMENSDRVSYLPFGTCAAAEFDQLDRLLQQQPLWLEQQLRSLQIDENALVLLDAPSWPSPLAQQALVGADLVLVALDASVRSCQARALVQSMLEQAPQRALRAILITGFDPRCKSQCEAVQTLRAHWTQMVIPVELHQDESMSEALSQASSVTLTAPSAQSAHDLHDIASWVIARYRDSSDA